MQRPKFLLTAILLFGSIAVFSQKQELINNYIEQYKSLAIAEMIRTGVPAAITLAQGIHESGAGNSQLASASNNHFGIKCKSNWTGESVKHDDDARGECFRKYPSVEDSYRDHSDFLKNGARYTGLFSIDPADYTEWANGLRKAGYATNPKYPEMLIKLIEDYHLQDYTLIALNKPESSIQNPVSSIQHPESSIQHPASSIKKDYPAGLFKLNDTKVVFIPAGTSYLTVAKEYDIDLSKIFEFNEISRAEVTTEDQLIFLQRKRKTGYNEFHVVQPGESLHDIAQEEAIRLESLMELNWLKEGERPMPGEKIYLKSKAVTIPKLAIKENYSLIPALINSGN